MRVRVPALHVFETPYWYDETTMTEYGRRFCEWLDTQDAQARRLAGAIRAHRKDRYHENEPEKWVARFDG